MKKILHLIVAFLELALIIGTFAVNYFTDKKMGMRRYVVFKNTRWDQNYPLELLRILTVVVIAVLSIAVLVFLWKKIRQKNTMVKVLMAETAVLCSAYVGFNLFYSVQTLRAFYFISGMLALACVLQIGRLFISMLMEQS